MDRNIHNSTVPVIIVGGGWAGLAAAVELTQKQIPVLIIEAAKQLGGRTRRIHFADRAVDYGQHILFGGFRQILDLLETMAIPTAKVFNRSSYELIHRYAMEGELSFKLPSLPYPLKMLVGLGLARGLCWSDKICILRFLAYLRKQSYPQVPDQPLLPALQSGQQSASSIKRFWQPLCRLLMSTDLDTASFNIFASIMNTLILSGNDHADMLIPHGELSRVLADPAADYIEQHGGQIHLGHQVTGLHIEGDRVTGVQVEDQSVAGSHVILTSPASALPAMFAPHEHLQAIARQASNIPYREILQVYLHYPSKTVLPAPFICLPGPLTSFIADKRHQGCPGIMAVTVDGNLEALGCSEEEMLARTIAEVAAQFPHWEPPSAHLLMPVKDAAVKCSPELDTLRPDIATPVSGLWLAGEYVAGDPWPSLDNAVATGRRCARQVIAAL